MDETERSQVIDNTCVTTKRLTAFSYIFIRRTLQLTHTLRYENQKAIWCKTMDRL